MTLTADSAVPPVPDNTTHAVSIGTLPRSVEHLRESLFPRLDGFAEDTARRRRLADLLIFANGRGWRLALAVVWDLLTPEEALLLAKEGLRRAAQSLLRLDQRTLEMLLLYQAVHTTPQLIAKRHGRDAVERSRIAFLAARLRSRPLEIRRAALSVAGVVDPFDQDTAALQLADWAMDG